MTTDQLRELAAKKAGERFKIEPTAWGIIPCGNDYKLQDRKTFLEGASLFLEPLAVAMDYLKSYGSMPDGSYSGPDDLYSDIGNPAREALAEIAAMLEK